MFGDGIGRLTSETYTNAADANANYTSSRPLIPRIRRSMIAGAFLDGVNVGALALLAVVTLQLSRAALIDVVTVAIAAASVALLICSRINSAWMISLRGMIGLLADAMVWLSTPRQRALLELADAPAP